MAELAEVLDALTIRPGDTLILRVDRGTTKMEAHEMMQHARQLLPDLKIAVVVAEQMLVQRGVDDG